MAVMDDVGVSPRGHTSSGLPVKSDTMPGTLASGDPASPVMAMEQRCEPVELHDFFSTSGIGDEQQHVVGLDHSKIAVLGFGGIDAYRRDACGGESRRDVGCDLTGLAHTRGHDLAAFLTHLPVDQVQSLLIGFGQRNGVHHPALGIKYITK